jgi:hypothetical protein
MPPKRPRDPNQLAKSIIDIATGEKPDREPTPEEQGKDPAAVAMGKKGEGAGRCPYDFPAPREPLSRRPVAELDQVEKPAAPRDAPRQGGVRCQSRE